jgi:hypothetical protein
LLDDALAALTQRLLLPADEAYFLTRGAQKLEADVFDTLQQLAKGTHFENKLELVSGFKFPDIVAYVNQTQGYGLEVKTTKQNGWTCIGNSVLESTRVDNIERIYLFFGKLAPPVGFKWRLYQACLPDVAVTHSPRYQIDMNLPEGASIFDKLGIPYDTLRNSGQPIKPIVDYYKQHLKSGESLWWMGDSDQEQAASITITLWSHLDKRQKDTLIREATCLFPEVLAQGQSKGSKGKYNRFVVWLVNKGIAYASSRDGFSAGGVQEVTIGNNNYSKVPKQVAVVLKDAEKIAETLANLPHELLADTWGEVIENDRLSQWLRLVSPYIQSQYTFSDGFPSVFQQALVQGAACYPTYRNKR